MATIAELGTACSRCHTVIGFTSSFSGRNVFRKPGLPRASRQYNKVASLSMTAEGFLRVALTREAGKNKKLRDATLAALSHVSIVELPCVTTIPGCDRDVLSETIRDNDFAWIVITSPEAAAVFLQGWRDAGQPALCDIAAVGEATGKVLTNAGLHITFEPSKATGKTLVAEIRGAQNAGEKVFYPASEKASNEIQEGLTAKGYDVVRINTYSTEAAVWSSQEKLLSTTVDVATFSSPSTVRGWTTNVSVDKDIVVACIGETSAAAATKAGFRRVFHPDSPGIPGWVDAIRDAVASITATESNS